MKHERGNRSNETDLRAAMDAWGDAVLRLARCRTRNKTDAEDVFQTVFLKLCEHKTPFQSDEHIKAWLFRVTINCCNDMRKSAWNARRVDNDGIPEPLAPPSMSDATYDLDEAIDSLPDKQRVVVHLYYFEGYSTEEIAEITSENPATVRSHLHRARQALRISLGGTA